MREKHSFTWYLIPQTLSHRPPTLDHSKLSLVTINPKLPEMIFQQDYQSIQSSVRCMRKSNPSKRDIFVPQASHRADIGKAEQCTSTSVFVWVHVCVGANACSQYNVLVRVEESRYTRFHGGRLASPCMRCFTWLVDKNLCICIASNKLLFVSFLLVMS